MTEKCEVCGEPMPDGEEMFKYHGYSGSCPKPPTPKPTRIGFVEYTRLKHSDGNYYINVEFNGAAYSRLGPFDTQAECDRAAADLMEMMRSIGAKDMAGGVQ
ncbi:MAG: hypothetical protein KGL39_04650 [Patescibacteria group bacterium]|nr:hypothetical protein [Patescibacteria group bacterium]